MHCRYIAKPGESSILLNNLTPRNTYKISVSLLLLHCWLFSNYVITNSYFATRFYLESDFGNNNAHIYANRFPIKMFDDLFDRVTFVEINRLFLFL